MTTVVWTPNKDNKIVRKIAKELNAPFVERKVLHGKWTEFKFIDSDTAELVHGRLKEARKAATDK